MYIYLMEFEGNGEHFFKVGFSNNPERRRYSFTKYYNVFLIKKIPIINQYIEHHFHFMNLNSDDKYSPKINFTGMKECYKEVDIDAFMKLIMYLNSFYNSMPKWIIESGFFRYMSPIEIECFMDEYIRIDYSEDDLDRLFSENQFIHSMVTSLKGITGHPSGVEHIKRIIHKYGLI